MLTSVKASDLEVQSNYIPYIFKNKLIWMKQKRIIAPEHTEFQGPVKSLLWSH